MSRFYKLIPEDGEKVFIAEFQNNVTNVCVFKGYKKKNDFLENITIRIM